jgi:hypothetical protein
VSGPRPSPRGRTGGAGPLARDGFLIDAEGEEATPTRRPSPGPFDGADRAPVEKARPTPATYDGVVIAVGVVVLLVTPDGSTDIVKRTLSSPTAAKPSNVSAKISASFVFENATSRMMPRPSVPASARASIPSGKGTRRRACSWLRRTSVAAS